MNYYCQYVLNIKKHVEENGFKHLKYLVEFTLQGKVRNAKIYVNSVYKRTNSTRDQWLNEQHSQSKCNSSIKNLSQCQLLKKMKSNVTSCCVCLVNSMDKEIEWIQSFRNVIIDFQHNLLPTIHHHQHLFNTSIHAVSSSAHCQPLDDDQKKEIRGTIQCISGSQVTDYFPFRFIFSLPTLDLSKGTTYFPY